MISIRNKASGTFHAVVARRRLRRRIPNVLGCLLTIVALFAFFLSDAFAQPVRGQANFAAAKGYARLVLTLQEDVESDVSVAGSILVIRFKKPVDIAVDGLGEAVPDYVGAARRDPDGTAIRLALLRKVTVNTMTAGERIFIDLLPDTWTGILPGLPQEVVRELAERARVAERALRQQQIVADAQKQAPVRVRASVQPTFTRFTFELPRRIGVSTSLNEGKFAIVFDSALTFDLSEASHVAPSQIASTDQTIEGAASTVTFRLIGDVDVRSFREDNNFVVDVTREQDKAARATIDETISKLVKSVAPPAAKPADAPPSSVAAAPVPAPPAPPSVALPPVAPPFLASAADASPSAVAAPPAPAVQTQVSGGGGDVRIHFAFAGPTPAAAFRHGDTLWLVFDTESAIDLDAVSRDAGSIVGHISRLPHAGAQVLRLRLNRPQLASLSGDGAQWLLTLADTRVSPSQALGVVRHLSSPTQGRVVVPLAGREGLHRIVDPDTGDTLVVATIAAPAQGFVKRQSFVDFAILESIHGVVVKTTADDVMVTPEAESLTIGRPGGLTLSPADIAAGRAAVGAPGLFDAQEWQDNRDAPLIARRDALLSELASANERARLEARLALARFYMARGFYLEAKGMADLALAGAKAGQENPAALLLRGIANILAGRPAPGLRDLAGSSLEGGTNFDLWRALALAEQGKWSEAREKFKNAEFAVMTVPVELQRIVLMQAMRASLEVKDYSGASARDNDLTSVGIPPDLQPAIALLRGQLAQALDHDDQAMRQFRLAATSEDRPSATDASLRMIAHRLRQRDASEQDILPELETLSVMWRGDAIEVRALSMLASIYAREGRYRDALAAARTATRIEPDADQARAMQDDAATLFAQIFRGQKGTELAPVDALALFYEFQELTPIGRRGDEIIRKLADRLVAVDLLEQASALLQYQVDHRLEGAARAQVAARLAMVYLMNRKPDRAIGVLRATRIADLAHELRQQRVLIEARAQSDVGRHDLALDIIGNLSGREAIRLRSDVYWAARRWRESAEQIELLYGARWRDFAPLTAEEKGDVLRAAIGYALAEDSIGLARFADKYMPKMSEPADRAAFEVAVRPASDALPAFSQIAKMAASVDTLDGFVREMKASFPDAVAHSPARPDLATPDAAPTGSLPRIVGTRAEAAR